MDGPPPEYSVEETRIADRLQSCGLNRAGFTVTYEDWLQSFEIVISEKAGPSENDIECIHEAAGYEIVSFEDPDLQRAYDKHVSDLLAPERIAENQRYLEERGLLDSAPTLAKFGNLTKLAIEIERLCGFEPGSILTVQGDDLMLGGPGSALLDADYEQSACLLALIRYSGVTKFGFVGNEKYRAEDD
ncbi:hypothetical protein [Qipengyuania sp. ASV99]|uniref:hypothetical protein n=1 Tax=Qipengyuania sp. ASV99 TaxID=3399681 RepID=UPI003A4C593F